MERGIIVVDMPEYCDCCPIGRVFGFESGVECLVASERSNRVSGYGFHVKKPDWCPIRPMPKMSEVTPLSPSSYLAGWNDCVSYLEDN